MKQYCIIFVLLGILSSCSKNYVKPSYISFEYKNDSIYVKSKNHFHCPVFNTIKNTENNSIKYVQFLPLEIKDILKFHIEEETEKTILKKIRFTKHYGYYEETKQAYDTIYNYSLPYLKGKKFKIIQGYNGSFSHNNTVSRYTLDFNTQIGDTITASREGIVIKTIMNHNKQGTTYKFRPYANYIVVYHSDNTFAQYVHLKQNSNFIKVGDTVTTNQPIALSGFTGLTTEPHLHFGVFKSNKKGIYSVPILLNSLKGQDYSKNKTYLND